MESKSKEVNEQIEFGLDLIDPNEKVEINLKDLVHIYKTFEEFNRFFHQPSHCKNITDLATYLGNRDQGAYSVIHKMYYKLLDKYLDEDLKDKIGEGELNNPKHPYYYK